MVDSRATELEVFPQWEPNIAAIQERLMDRSGVYMRFGTMMIWQKSQEYESPYFRRQDDAEER